MQNPEIQVQYVEEDQDFELIYQIRAAVFQEEYGLDEEAELDGHEHISHHYLASIKVDQDQWLPVGTARWRMTMAGKAKLERFAVLKSHRHTGIGRALATAILKQVPRGREVFLEALEPVIGFYERLGFIPEGEPYEVEGLKHIRMRLKN